MINRILIVGYGSAGKRYHKIIRKNFPLTILRIFSSNNQKKSKIFLKKKKEIKKFSPQLSIICTPASKRAKIIKFLIELKSHLLIEKPLASNFKEVQKVQSYAKKSRLIIKVGYNLRFLNSLKTLNYLVKSKKIGKIYFVDIFAGKNLTQWRKNSNYKHTVSAQKNLGGGVLLELSHEIDYVNWIFGKFDKIFCKAFKASNLKINVEDTAKILLFAKNKHTVNISIDFCRNDEIRKCYVAAEKGSLIWDGLKNNLNFFNIKKKKWIKFFFKKNTINDTYFLQLKEMIRLCNSKKRFRSNLVDLFSSSNTVRLIDLARNSSRFLKVKNII
jgi:predicted dehydrogenase